MTTRTDVSIRPTAEVDDFATATWRAAELGGQPVSAVHTPSQPWQVWADPEGNEFCLITAD